MKNALALTRLFALLGFVVGGLAGAIELWGRSSVREFQAHDVTTPLGERLFAVAQRAAVEGVGWAAVGLFLGLIAAAVSALGRRGSSTDEPTRGERFSAVALFATAIGWAWVMKKGGAWLMNEAVAFLPPGDLLPLNLAGFLALLAGAFVFRALAGLLPLAPRGRRGAALALSAGSLLALGIAAWASLQLALRAPGAWKSAGTLGGAAGLFLVALPLAAVLARALAGPLSRLTSLAPLQGTALRRARAALVLLLVVCAIGTRPFVHLGAQVPDTVYERMTPRGEPAGPNVVLITVDTLRADALSCYGYERETSPFLDTLAEAGTLFDQPVSAAAWTKPATGTILTGLYPSRHGALYHGSSLRLPEGERTLAEAFQAAGYSTAGFVTNPNVKAVFDFDRGFDEYFDSPVEDTVHMASVRDSWFGKLFKRISNHQFNWKYENDVRGMNQHITAWLRENHDVPFFLYLHYIDPHEPYAPPSEYDDYFPTDHGLPLFNERKRLVGRDLYDREIRYTDDGLRELVDVFKELGIWEDTLFVLTSDHGEEFYEHEVLGHGYSLYQEVVRVPLLFHGPGVAKGRVVEEPTQILDLGASILDLARTGDSRLGDGRSFASRIQGDGPRAERELFVENEFGEDDHDIRSFVLKSVRRGPWKLVLTEQSKYRPPGEGYPAKELYNLEEDPHERNNLFQDERFSDEERALVEALLGHGTFLEETGFRDVAPAELSPELEAELRALGYL
jgi:arylsulfatase A-like enzyme